MIGYDWILSHDNSLHDSSVVLLCMSAPCVWTAC